MKKSHLLVLSLMLLSISSFAQLQKGNLLLGGNVNFQTATTNLDNSNAVGGSQVTSNSFSFGPVLGYFISDRTVMGLKLSYLTSSSENNPQTGQISTIDTEQILMGPFLRRYFPAKDWLAFYGQAEVSYGSAKQFQEINANSSSTEMKTRSVNFIASLGLSFFPTKWMSIDLSANPLSFFHQNSQTISKGQNISENPATYELTTTGLNLNFNSNSFFLGAHFFLNRK